jgi:ribose transport system substrate-binding protein
MDIPALASKPAAGKTIDFIACGVPSCQAFTPLLQQAAATIGWTVKAINSGVTPQTVAAAYDQAVRDSPAGVIGSGGNDPSIFAHQLAELKNEGVPVVLQVVPPTSLPGVTAVVDSATDMTTYGKDLANVIMADSGGKDVHVGFVSTPQTPIYSYVRQPIAAMTASSGCVSCSQSTFSFPESDLGTALPNEVVTYVRSHPDVNYLVFDFADEVDGVPAALQRAGLSGKVKILTTDTKATEDAYIEAGQELATAGMPWPEILWTEVNIIVTKAMGQPLGPAEAVKLPSMILTKDNLPSSNGQPYFPLVTDYQSLFEKAWHVS